MVGSYFDGVLPAPAEPATAERVVARRRWPRRPRAPTRAIGGSTSTAAIAAIWDFVDALNGYLTEQEPWEVAKDADASRRAAGRRSSTRPPRACAPSPSC